jgi:serine/threonine protein kinase
MELLDSNLADFLRKEKLSLDSKKRILSETLSAIKEIHLNGYIHRDIKPANFARRLGKEKDWVLIDFGLAREYTRNGEHVEQRAQSSFRGSISYASLNSHGHQDLSCRDDIWSWFYMLIEVLSDDLPWRGVKEDMEKDMTITGGTAKLKQECAKNPCLFFNNHICPKEIIELNRYLLSLDFQDPIDYDFIQDSILEIQIQAKEKDPPTGTSDDSLPRDAIGRLETSTRKRDRNSPYIRSSIENSASGERSNKIVKPSFKSVPCDDQNSTSTKMALQSYGNVLQLIDMLRSVSSYKML